MAEYTATTYMNPAKRAHFGVNAIAVNYVLASASIGDVILLAKLPHGARIVDFWEQHTAADTLGISFGLKTGGPGGSATYSLLVSAGAKGSRNTYGISAIPALVSASDADSNRFGVLAAKLDSGSATTTGATINCVCLYVCDGVT